MARGKEREQEVFCQKATDYHITGTRCWTDLSGAEQDEYLLGCFKGESDRRVLEKWLDLFDRTASSIADGLLGPFRQYDINTGEAHYQPENLQRALKVFTIREDVLRGTPLGERLSRARIRQFKGRMGTAAYEDDPKLRFYGVGPRGLLGLYILDEKDYGGFPAVPKYEGPWNDWAALEFHQLRERRSLEVQNRKNKVAAPSEPNEPAAKAPPKIENTTTDNPSGDVIQVSQERRTRSEAAIKATLFQKLLWKVWPPQESKIALQSAMELLEGTYSEALPIRASCRAVLRNAEVVLHCVRQQGYSPDELGLVVVRNIIADYLCSGRYHVYRGILSVVGKQVNADLRKTCSELEKRGYTTPDESREYLRQVSHEIKLVG